MAATTKIWLNGSAPSCEDDDLNGFKEENNNLIVGSGQVLSTADHQQSHKAVAVYAAGGEYYTDSGAANAYVLNVVGAKVAPPTLFVGMRVAFTAGGTNTGASTVNPAGLGVIGLKMPNGSATPAGAVTAGRLVVARYDGANFILSIETLASAAGVAEQSKAVILGEDKSVSGLGNIAVGGALRTMPNHHHIDIGDLGSLREDTASKIVSFGSNTRNDGTNERYIANGFAGLLQISPTDAAMRFYTAPNGVAGNIATFTQRLAVLNDGTAFLNLNQIWDQGNLAAGTRGALVYHNTTQSIPNNTPTTLTWNSEDYDTDSIHDLVTNPSRLTVPSGVSKIKLHSGIFYTGTINEGIRSFLVIKNGGAMTAGRPNLRVRSAGSAGEAQGTILSFSSPVINVSSGDYFEINTLQTSGIPLNIESTTTAGGSVYFAMEIIK